MGFAFQFSAAQQAVFDNSGTFTATSYLYTFPAYPTPLGSPVSLRLGYGYSLRSDRMVAYGGGYRNSWHKDAIGSPWMKWQEQMFFSLSATPPFTGGYTWDPGKRYLANRHNWGGYQGIFGLRERTSTIGLVDIEAQQWGFVENEDVKDAVISFAYPNSAPDNKKSRLIIEKIELDTVPSFSQTDANTELATITYKGNLGFRSSSPEARIEIKGNDGQSTGNYKAIRILSDGTSPIENFVLNNGNTAGTKASMWLNHNISSPPNSEFYVLGNSIFKQNTTTQNGIEIDGPTKKLLYSKDDDLFLDYFKNTSASPQYAYLTLDRHTGQLQYLPIAAVQPTWELSGNTFPTGTSSAIFGSLTGSADVDILYKLGGNTYGKMYGNVTSNRGLFEWYGSYALGGDNTTQPQATHDATLYLLARDNVNAWSFSPPYRPSSIIRCENLYTNTTGTPAIRRQSFEVYNTGHTYIGDMSNHGHPFYALLSIGESSSDDISSPTQYALCGYKPGASTPYMNFSFDMDDGSLEFANHAYGLDVTGEEFTWKGKIYPTATGTYNLGETGSRWKEIHGLELHLGANSKLQQSTSANLMTWDGDIVPYTGGTNDIGSSSAAWADIYATGTIGPSDRRLKTNINEIHYGLKEVLKLSPVSYHYINYKKNNNLRFGFIAQDLQQVLPGSVVIGNETDSTYLGVRYVEIIPILTKAIQEQQNIIEEQRREIEIIKTKLPGDGSLVKNNSNGQLNKEPILFQNTPNPFSQQTFIDYFIPENSNQASIVVVDVAGKIVYSYIINTVGMGRVSLTDTALAQGNYFYTLYVNGRLIDTKKLSLVRN